MVYVIANIIVLIFEVLYYSMFMYFSKEDGKFWKYILLFIFISIFGGIIGTNNLMSYIYLILMIFIGINNILKVRMYFRDIFVIIAMIFFGVLIQFPLYLIGSLLQQFILFSFIYEIVKVILTFVLKNKIRKIYLWFEKAWNKNNFYVRYICSISLFIYVIITVLLLIAF